MVSNKASTNEGNKRIGNQMANRQRFKPGMNKQYNPMGNMRSMSAMFNANQLGDDPGFVDFNDDTVTSTTNGTGNNVGGPKPSVSNVSDGVNKNLSFANGNRRMNPPMKRPMKNGAPGMRNRMNGGANGMSNWGHPMPPPNMFPGPPSAGRRGHMNPPPIPPPIPPAHFRNGPGMRMRGPHRYGAGHPGPMSLLSMNRPLPPPIPPMPGRSMPPPPGGMGRMMPPPLRHGLDGPMRRHMNGNMHARGMGGKIGPFPRNGMAPNGGAIGPNGKRTRAKATQHQNREEYPLDKPWVTQDIKAEHDKKAELANRLKGHRDDALFAQFKEQRDKFVKMYEAARLEYIGKHPEQDVDKILTASACKKARIENVEKPNVAADNTAKTEATTISSAQVTTDATVLSSNPTEPTKCDTNGSTVGIVGDTNASPTNATTIDTNDTTEITSTSANEEQLPAETETSPIATTIESTVPV
ncbi:DNA-binding protein K10 [Anopheles funestus]|uniref:DNA-binding protein K10 n=1 Tax=Anopheles funestus TaxID=62324 RepID=UPI0020C6D431|nr:DNA-binding protein K10 [Anopheles funestus]XP_049278232.1 DNA-binding protein K10 [Anopheles funestus]XP_049278233.1 DNA-binding protein K10 [Anopheles funestus]